jgi:hypothetical protein
MNSQRQVRLLRFHLLANAKMTQRALDYSIKGYSLRSLEFARHIASADHDGEQHSYHIKELCRELMSGGSASASDAHFAFAALSIGNALHGAQSAAVGIAQDTVRLLESTGIQPCAALDAAGRHVNAAMRIAVIALFASNVSHAHAVLRQKPWVQLRQLNSVAMHPHIDRWSGAQGDFERSVIRNLGEVAKQTHEMADAILFWLDADCYTAARLRGSSPAVGQPVCFSSRAAAPGLSC